MMPNFQTNTMSHSDSALLTTYPCGPRMHVEEPQVAESLGSNSRPSGAEEWPTIRAGSSRSHAGRPRAAGLLQQVIAVCCAKTGVLP
jgi:hypothetical protein